MKLPKTKSTLLWRQAIRELSAGNKPLDPEDIVWLWQLAERVFSGPGRRLAFARAPVLLPTVNAAGSGKHLCLYPISLRATEWLIRVSEWWPGSDLLPAGFACAHSDGMAHAILDSRDQRQITDQVTAWAVVLPCSVADLRLAVQIQIATPDAIIDTEPQKADTSATDWGEILATLSGAYHVPPWELLERPYADIVEMLDHLPSVAGIYRDIAQDKDRRIALREFQAAVLHLKRGGATT